MIILSIQQLHDINNSMYCWDKQSGYVGIYQLFVTQSTGSPTRSVEYVKEQILIFGYPLVNIKIHNLNEDLETWLAVLIGPNWPY